MSIAHADPFQAATLPPPETILDQISARRQEIRALQRMLKLSQAQQQRHHVDAAASTREGRANG